MEWDCWWGGVGVGFLSGERVGQCVAVRGEEGGYLRPYLLSLCGHPMLPVARGRASRGRLVVWGWDFYGESGWEGGKVCGPASRLGFSLLFFFLTNPFGSEQTREPQKNNSSYVLVCILCVPAIILLSACTCSPTCLA